ncbi:MAG: hypothetical protein HC933_22320, partial [Pleurocapsa sp. SU_196_0]|nr:hypothetical protein [Pleurocapsa sp. SU_196_0]
ETDQLTQAVHGLESMGVLEPYNRSLQTAVWLRESWNQSNQDSLELGQPLDGAVGGS